MRRRRAVVLVLGAGSVLALARRRRDARRDRITLVYEDGSSLTLEAGATEGDHLLALARTAVAPA